MLKKTAKVLHMSMPSQCKLATSYPMCPAEPMMCCQCITRAYRPRVTYLLDCFTEYSLTHSTCVVHVFVLCVIFCDLRSQSHSDDNHVHATALCFVCVFVHARPTMLYIHLENSQNVSMH